MTPKEKAIEFKNKFGELSEKVVDEILQSKPAFLNSKNDVVDFLGNTETELFYRKVKQEIEKL